MKKLGFDGRSQKLTCSEVDYLGLKHYLSLYYPYNQPFPLNPTMGPLLPQTEHLVQLSSFEFLFTTWFLTLGDWSELDIQNVLREGGRALMQREP